MFSEPPLWYINIHLRRFHYNESKFDQFKGNVKETVGNVTDNKELEKKVNKIKRLVKQKKLLKMLKIK